MTLKEQFQHNLAGLAPFSSSEQQIECADGPLRLTCDLVALDSLACAFTRLVLSADVLSTLSNDALKNTALRLAGRLTYLLEPISPIETDAEGCVVQMRSNPPHKETDRTSYYELLVSRSGHLSLCRYARLSGRHREVIAAHVTREVLSRLVGDFAASVA